MRHSPDAGLNLSHRSRTKSALACGEPRSPPRVATLSRYYALSEVGPTHHSTHIAFGVRPTPWSLSCGAKAHVPKPRGARPATFAPRQRRERMAGGGPPAEVGCKRGLSPGPEAGAGGAVGGG